MHINGNSVTCACALEIIIEHAYGVIYDDVIGPSWVASGPDRFEVRAQLPSGATSNDVPSMLRELLASRFHLIVHWEQRETDVYQLVLAGDGLKARPAQPEDPEEAMRGNLPFFGWGRFFWNAPATMPRVATILSGIMGRPVIDRTGTTGTFQITLDARVPTAQLAPRSVLAVENPIPEIDGPQKDIHLPPFSGGKTISADAPSIFTEIQKLGLKLVPVRAPVPHLVVDSVDRTPTAN